VSGCRIAILAKAPVAGQAKTRLAPALGEAGAAWLAERLLDHAVGEALAADTGAVTLWAAPNTRHPAFQTQAARGVALAEQGGGDLGARMVRALAAGPGPVLLMGTDLPDLGAAVLREAAALLQAHDAVFVPAQDGGYGLVGVRNPDADLLALLFDGMRWSVPEVMAVTRARLAASPWRHAELPPLADVDEPADLQHVPPAWLPAVAGPGRSCPLHYHYGPRVFARAPAQRCEVLYVVGGLYGNAPALEQVLALFDAEPGEAGVDKRLVFNGDFHWFDTDPTVFAQVQEQVLRFDALRGNVETELAAEPLPGDDAGCGCAYPAWVGDGVVERSNRILQRLRDTARHLPGAAAALGALPMWLRLNVGDLRVAAVHGDAQSLAGWGFAAEHLRDADHRATVTRWFEDAQVDAFACSHTCLPVFQALPRPGGEPAWVLNNGAAGMPNFRGDGAGLLTRIATRPFTGAPALRRHGVVSRGVHVDALAVDSVMPAWRTLFLRQWPAGSDAHASYWQRLCEGPAHGPADALQPGAA
jgi:rSAM/selenodomain-associated transferase 1